LTPKAKLGGLNKSMITGINHLTFSIRDLDNSLAFYTEILGFRTLARWPRGAWLQAGGLWIALLVDEKVRNVEMPEYTHIAF
jgi:catechol 2,3-dioxygenase-like lactoylglutathione lyase family enzyme